MTVLHLEQAIATSPEDDDVRRVLADALEERGDPRAEHIVLAFRARTDREARHRLRELDEAASARLTAFSRHIPGHVVRLRWRLGLVERIDVEGDGEVDLEGLAALVAAPECCALRELDLRRARGDLFAPLDDWLARRPIRWLGVRHRDPVAIARLLERHPRVDGLGVVTDGPHALMAALADLPLTALDVAVAAGGDWVTRLLEHPWPLERLVVERFARTDDAEALEPVLRGDAYPRLTTFGAMGAPLFTLAMLDRLQRAPLRARLTALGLRASTETTTWLLDHRYQIAHVELFTSDAEANDGGAWRALAGACVELGRHHEACPALEAWIAHRTSDAAYARIALAESRLVLGDAGAAVAAIDVALADKQLDHGARAGAWRVRARACAELGREHDAIEACNSALDLEPDSSWTYQFLGTTLREAGHRHGALEAFAKAVRCAIEHDAEHLGRARVLYGHMLWSVRRRDEAIVELVAAARSNDPEAARQAEVHLGCMAQQRGDVVEARERFERADARDRLAAVCFEQGEFLDAYGYWYPSDDEQQGHALIALGRADEVLDVTRGRARACALHVLGRIDEAIAALDEVAPGRKPCVYHRASGLLLHGLWARDAKVLERARPADFAAAMRELPDAACTVGQCGRKLGTVGALAALALGRTDEAHARANAVIDQITRLYATETLTPMWEARAAVPLLPEHDRAFARRLVRAAELCLPEL